MHCVPMGPYTADDGDGGDGGDERLQDPYKDRYTKRRHLQSASHAWRQCFVAQTSQWLKELHLKSNGVPPQILFDAKFCAFKITKLTLCDKPTNSRSLDIFTKELSILFQSNFTSQTLGRRQTKNGECSEVD